MEIVRGYPPNFDKISAALPGANKDTVIFAYHPYVYKPHGELKLPASLIAHEQVHLNRQAADGPELWWDQYISSAAFRLEEEGLAHLAEARAMAKQAKNCNRKKRREIAAFIGGRLASPLYGAGTSRKAAIKVIMASLG